MPSCGTVARFDDEPRERPMSGALVHLTTMIALLVFGVLADRLVKAVIDVPAQQRGSVLRAERRFHQVSCLRKAARIGAHIAASAWLAMWPLSDGIST